MKPLKPMTPAEKWWPEDLGAPASTGAQNDLRYAFFPKAKRLLVERNGDLTTYDSGAHRISGVSQQGSGQHGLTSPAQQGRCDWTMPPQWLMRLAACSGQGEVSRRSCR